MSRSFRYRVVDVFTEVPLEGNPLAVFPDARGLDDRTMQAVAKELNLSETVFVFPPVAAGCAAKIRIFTPVREMPFAGHPTVGTSFVVIEEGLVARDTAGFHLEEGVGPVAVRVERGARTLFWLTTPPITFGRTLTAEECAAALSLEPGDLLGPEPQLVSAGNPCIFIALTHQEAVDRAWCDLAGAKRLRGSDAQPPCIFVFAPSPKGAYSRMFAPEHGVVEDPATGSATGPLAAYMLRHRLGDGAPGARFVSEQGVKMGRRSVLHVHVRGVNGAEGIEVGGEVAPLVEGTMRLP